MVEIDVGKHIPEEWVLSRRRADPVPPAVFEKVLDEVCARVREDNLKMRNSSIAISPRVVFLRS